MNPYLISIGALVAGLLGQALASGMAFEYGLRVQQGKLLWFAIALGALLLGLNHGYTIEMALKTGIYDFRAALLGGLAGLLQGLAVLALTRRS
ncbi:hypothetical protein [Azonexus sp. R2A61]|uniref:hypothetical protein n=1 Tax=Azonexus sp. R2A61 TaxID=2744443 RepID=UPI001F30F9FB|nr:hypothetical protein [Azonexus sp. R2A61]